jgi:hypothetical protein
VLDIKPYISYADSISEANSGWATPVLPTLEVKFSDIAMDQLHYIKNKNMDKLITETLSYDPRPGYERGNPKLDNQSYFIKILGSEIEWSVEEQVCTIKNII